MSRPRSQAVVRMHRERTRVLDERWTTAVTELRVGRRGLRLRFSRIVDDPSDMMLDIEDTGRCLAFAGSTPDGAAFEIRGSAPDVLRSLGHALLTLADHLERGGEQ